MFRYNLKKAIEDASKSQNNLKDAPRDFPSRSSNEVQPDPSHTAKPKATSQMDQQGSKVDSGMQAQQKNTTAKDQRPQRPSNQKTNLDVSDSPTLVPGKPGTPSKEGPKAELRSKKVEGEDVGWGEWLMQKYIASKMSGTTDGANDNKDNRKESTEKTRDVEKPDLNRSSTEPVNIPHSSRPDLSNVRNPNIPEPKRPQPGLPQPKLPSMANMPKWKMPRLK